MAATLEQIRAAIVGKMTAIESLGRVHTFQRYDKNLGGLESLYRAEIDGVEQIRGWYVTRVATTEESPALGRYIATHTWQIRGFLSLNDAAQSEIVMDGLIEQLRDAFRTDETLGGVVDTTVLDDGAGLQLDEQLPVMFAGVLCHLARCTLRTRHNL